MRYLVLALLLSGCCFEEGPPRLTGARIETSANPELTFSGEEKRMTRSAYFSVSRLGSPDAGRIRTIPMLEMVSERDGRIITLDRFDDSLPNACGHREIYDPVDEELEADERYLLVHRASASPGDLADSGFPKGALANNITSFDGEAALVAVVRIIEP